MTRTRQAPLESPVRHPGAAVMLQRLHKSYGPVHAVRGIDLHIAAGEVVALLGPNGAGKTSTLELMLGLSRPDTGSVEIFGHTPRQAVTQGVAGAMLQDGGLLDDARVGETLRLFAALHRQPRPLPEVMAAAGIADLATRKISQLSGGQRQRVSFACALVCDPDLLVLDEPTVGMDVATRRSFWESMHGFTDAGRTVLFATHYLAEAEEFADRVVLMRDGLIAADGPVRDVRAAAGGRQITAEIADAEPEALRRLIGVQRVSLLDAAEDGSRAQRFELTSQDSDSTLRALLQQYPQAAQIEVTPMGLEAAFLALTGDPDAGETHGTEKP